MTSRVAEVVAAAASSRRTLVLWAGIGLGLLASLMLVARGQPALTWPLARLLEAWAVIGLVGVFASRRGFVELVRGGPATARVLLVVVVLGFGWAQYGIWSNDTTYPFVDWNMYTAPVSEITYYDFLMLEDGEPAGPLPVSQVAPTRSPRGLVTTLSSRAVDAADGDQMARAELELAIAVIVDHAAIDDSVDAVRIDRCDVTAPVEQGSSTACEPLVTIDLADLSTSG